MDKIALNRKYSHEGNVVTAYVLLYNSINVKPLFELLTVSGQLSCADSTMYVATDDSKLKLIFSKFLQTTDVTKLNEALEATDQSHVRELLADVIAKKKNVRVHNLIKMCLNKIQIETFVRSLDDSALFVRELVNCGVLSTADEYIAKLNSPRDVGFRLMPLLSRRPDDDLDVIVQILANNNMPRAMYLIDETLSSICDASSIAVLLDGQI